jgi:hypothetical protein
MIEVRRILKSGGRIGSAIDDQPLHFDSQNTLVT